MNPDAHISVLNPPDPPNNIEAEQALLGAILVNNQAVYRVSDFLTAEHFHEPLHGRIYEAAKGLIFASRRATPVTLKTNFVDDPHIGELTVPQYLGRLAANATTIINAEDYGRTVYDLFSRRRLVEIARELLDRAQSAPIDERPDQIIEATETDLAALAETGRSQTGLFTMAGALTDAIGMIANAYKRNTGYSGIPTHFRDLDNKLGGLQASDLIIVAGRPAMGKTALATNIAHKIAERHMRFGQSEEPEGCPVAFFSLEMSAEQLVTRIVSEQCHLPSHRLRRGRIDSDEFDRIVEVAEEQSNVPLYIDQTGGLNVHQLCARARRLKVLKKIGLIVVDYLQLLTGTNRRRDSRTVEVTEITTSLKALAKELNVPIIALSQLSREVEKREDKRPQLSDLRESGSIEQDADVVMFVFREEYYVERREPKENTAAHLEWKSEIEACQGKAEIIIGKSRHGPTGTVEIAFNSELTRFSDLAKGEGAP